MPWDFVADIATAAYNMTPHTLSGESPFFLMFGRDPVIPLNSLLVPRVRYLADTEGRISLEVFRNCLQAVAKTLLDHRNKRTSTKPSINHPLKEGDMVLVLEHISKQWEPRFRGPWRLLRFLGQTQAVISDAKGQTKTVHLNDLKRLTPADNLLPPLETAQLGRTSALKLRSLPVFPAFGQEAQIFSPPGGIGFEDFEAVSEKDDEARSVFTGLLHCVATRDRIS